MSVKCDSQQGIDSKVLVEVLRWCWGSVAGGVEVVLRLASWHLLYLLSDTSSSSSSFTSVLVRRHTPVPSCVSVTRDFCYVVLQVFLLLIHTSSYFSSFLLHLLFFLFPFSNAVCFNRLFRFLLNFFSFSYTFFPFLYFCLSSRFCISILFGFSFSLPFFISLFFFSLSFSFT